MNIDAGLDFDFGEDLLSLVAHDYTSPNGLKIKVGGDDLKYDEATKTLTVPKTLKLNIKGTLDFVNIKTLARLQRLPQTIKCLQNFNCIPST